MYGTTIIHAKTENTRNFISSHDFNRVRMFTHLVTLAITDTFIKTGDVSLTNKLDSRINYATIAFSEYTIRDKLKAMSAKAIKWNDEVLNGVIDIVSVQENLIDALSSYDGYGVITSIELISSEVRLKSKKLTK